jgi:hypothetical protein
MLRRTIDEIGERLDTSPRKTLVQIAQQMDVCIICMNYDKTAALTSI